MSKLLSSLMCIMAPASPALRPLPLSPAVYLQATSGDLRGRSGGPIIVLLKSHQRLPITAKVNLPLFQRPTGPPSIPPRRLPFPTSFGSCFLKTPDIPEPLSLLFCFLSLKCSPKGASFLPSFLEIVSQI